MQHAMTADEETPKNYKQAMASAQKNEWKKAMDAEIKSLQQHETWTLVNVNEKQKVIEGRRHGRLRLLCRMGPTISACNTAELPYGQ